MSTTKAQRAAEAEARIEAIDQLRKMYPPGSLMMTDVAHVSRSGMYRAIKVIYGYEDGSASDISWMVARATGEKLDHRHGGIGVTGCGMDMGFHLVYCLSRVIYPDGHQCTGVSDWGNRCPSNDHSNGERTYSNELHHRDGGYAIRHRQL